MTQLAITTNQIKELFIRIGQSNSLNSYSCKGIFVFLVLLAATSTILSQEDIGPHLDFTLIAGDAPNGNKQIINRGDDVTFSYILNNTGTIDLNVNSIKDSEFGEILPFATLVSGDDNNNKILNTNEIWTYVFDAKGIESNIKNTATVITNPVDEFGFDLPGFQNLLASDNAFVESYFSGINIINSVDNTPDGVTHEIFSGESVTHNYVISNTGDTDLASLTLVDNPHGSIMIVGTLFNGELLSGDIDNDHILDTNEKWTFSLMVENISSNVTSIGIVSANPVTENGIDIPGLGNPTDSDMAVIITTQSSTVSGSVLEDLDGDGLGDKGIKNVRLTISDSSENSQSIITDKNGFYSFTNILSGPFTIKQNQPNEYMSVSDSEGDNDNIINGVLTAGMSSSGNDFIEVKQSQIISGFVFADTSGDGFGDIPMMNVDITVEDSNNEIQNTKTDVKGQYAFFIPEGKFTVYETDPIGYSSISDTQGENNNNIQGEIEANQQIEGLDFVDAQNAKISGKVMMDHNDDGTPDLPVIGSTIYMIDQEENRQLIETNQDGYYSFSVMPGTYTIVQKDLKNYTSISDVDGLNDNIIKGRILPGSTKSGMDFLDAARLSDCEYGQPSITITNNVCASNQQGSIVLNSGCRENTIAEFSTDNGINWTTRTPIYDPINPLTILSRCKDLDPACLIENFDFESLVPSNDPVSDITGAALNANGISLQNMTVVTNGTAMLDDFEINDDHLAGTFGPKLGVQNGNGLQNNLTASYQFSEPILDLCILINDLDQNDAIVVNGSLAGSTPITLSANDYSFPFGIGACPIFVGNNAFESQCFGGVGNISNSMQGAVKICFPSPIDKIDLLFYDWNNSGGGSYTLSAMEVCVPQEACISDTLTVNTDPELCCVPPAAPTIGIVENVCNPSLDGEFTIITDCPAGSSIEYSTDNGTNWTRQIPTYPSTGNTVIARCNNENIANCVSENSNSITSNPTSCEACIELIKSASVDLGLDGIATPGDLITYSFDISNCGNVVLSNVILEEIKSLFTGTGSIPIPGNLASIIPVGSSVSTTATYEITQEDIDNGGVTNQAIVTADDPNSEEVIDNSDSGNPIDGEGPDDPTVTPLPSNLCVELIKSSSLIVGNDGIANPNDQIEYTFEVINCGNVTLSNIVIEENQNLFTGSNPLPIVSAVAPGSLAPGESGFATATYSISAQDINLGGVDNQAVVIAENQLGDQITDMSDSGNSYEQGARSDDRTTTPIAPDACIEIIKSSSINPGVDGIVNAGDQILYTYELKNCGNVLINNVSVSETQALFSGSGTLPVPSPVNPINLFPNEIGIATATYVLTQIDIDNGGVTNQALAIASDPNGDLVNDDSDSGNPLDQGLGSDDPTETPIATDPCIDIIKSSTLDLGPDGIATVGDMITYNYTITNCGNVTLSNVSIQESANMFTGNGMLPTPSATSNTTLLPGESTSSMATYILTQEDINQQGVTNQATAIANDPNGDQVMDLSDSDDPLDGIGGPDDPTNTPIDINPCIELIKSSSLDLGIDSIANAGDIINYTYEVTNCGNVELSNITIEEIDALFTGSNGTPVPSEINPMTLLPGQTGTGIASYTISQLDINQGGVDNQAIVTAADPNGDEVRDTSDSGNPIDIGAGTSDPTTTPIPSNPCIDIIKSSSLDVGADGLATPGDEITYTYQITNCGNIILSNIIIQELVSEFTGTGDLPVPTQVLPQLLAPGDSAVALSIYEITQEDINVGEVINSALAIGQNPNGSNIIDDSDSGNPLDDTGAADDPTVTPIPQSPCIDVIKSSVFVIGLESRANPGDQIVYEYEVRNCGNVSLSNIQVNEQLNLFTGTNDLPQINNQSGISLIPGALKTFAATYEISQEDIDAGAVSNQAIASGSAENGDVVSALSDSGNPLDETGEPDDPTVTPIPASPCIQLIKTSNIDVGLDFEVTPGDVIKYTYEVRNCGELSLSNIVIVESSGTFSGTGILPVPSFVNPSVIGPGESAEAFALYALTQEDIDSELVTNQAIVTADPSYGDPVMDDSDSGNPFDNNGTPNDPTTTPVANCETLACNSNVQISINASCFLVVTPDMILEDYLDNGAYTIEFYNNDGDFLRQDTLFVSDVGENINFKVYCGGNSCWGTISLEANLIPEIPAPCACTVTGEIPDECKYWCGMGLPDAILSPQEALEIYKGCGPTLLGGITTTEIKSGDLCSPEGEVIELIYEAKVLRHGTLEEIEILCQKYTIEKLDIELSESDFNKRFGFPRNVILDCNYLQEITSEEELTLGSPESIYAATGSGSLAFTYFVDQHQLVDLIRIDTSIIHVEVDTIHRQDIIEQDLDGDGQPEWFLAKIVDKIYEEQEVYDTTYLGKAHPEIPIIEQVCNLQTAFSDIEFNLCGGGVKIVRDWTVLDWCDSSIQRKGSQTIYIKDSHAPVVYNADGMPITELTDVLSIINPWECVSNVKLPELNIEDDCTDNIKVEWEVYGHDIEGGFVMGVSPAESPLEIKGIVKDDCGNELDIHFTAVIKDELAPAMVCEQEVQVVLVDDPNSNEASVKAFASQFDAGTNDLSCGNFTLTVIREEDWTEQATSCNGDRVGYLPVSCYAQVDTITISSKECGDESILISKPGAYAKFCCEDIGKELFVILIATDDSGNRNTCRVPVQVVSKTIPLMECKDQVVDCSNGDELVLPTMMSEDCNSSKYQIELLDESATEGVCSGGTIIREWYIDVDGSGSYNQGDSYCLQRLLIDGGTAFDPYSIKWPKSYDGAVSVGVDLHCDDDGNITEERAAIYMGDPLQCNPENSQFMPSWCESACNLVGYSMSIDTVNVDFACNKIIRSWKVIDWCTYDVNQEEDNVGDRIEAVNATDGLNCAPCVNEDRPHDNVYFRYEEVSLDGLYAYDQVIFVDDDTDPTIEVTDELSIEVTSTDPNKEQNSDCLGEVVVSATASDFCGLESTSASQLRWEIIVQEDSVTIASKMTTGALVDIAVRGQSGKSYKINWQVSDACGNNTFKSTSVRFIDNEAPTPLCIAGATTSYGGEDGTVEIWASDLNFGSFDNCTNISDLRFTIVPGGVAPIRPGEEGFEAQANINFECTEFHAYRDLNVWVWDSNGNGSFCNATIGINAAVCEGLDTMLIDTMLIDTMLIDTLLIDTMLVDTMIIDSTGNDTTNIDTTTVVTNSIIAGDIYTAAGLAIEGVDVIINSEQSEYPLSWTTFDEGHYAFDSNPNGFNYTIRATKDGDPLNGVSTIDLVLISRHIIGESQFENAFDFLAADANGDQRVSAVDLVDLKRLILGVTQDFGENAQSWNFLNASQEIFSQTNPWPFIDQIEIEYLISHRLSEDFIGIKTGDVNKSVAINNLQQTEMRSNGQMALQLQDEQLYSGQRKQIQIKAKNFKNVFGMQFSLAHHDIQIIDVIPGEINVNLESLRIGVDHSAFIWYVPYSSTVTDNDILFSIEVEAKRNVSTREVMAIHSDLIQAEAYKGDDFDHYDLSLEFLENASEFEVLQNQPNPFSVTTTIPIVMTHSGTVFVSIHDSQGKLLWSIEKSFDKGQQFLQIRDEDIKVEGILFYTVTSGAHSVTKQMLRVKT